MKVSGFTFVRNAVKFQYPIVESLQSLLPLCHEVIVALGDSDDDTEAVVRGIDDDRITIIPTVWDDTLRKGGRILAQQTDVALAHCTGDWCLYLQADEVLHERDYDVYRQALQSAHQDANVEALVLQWLHFYATYQHIGVGRQWYRREIRAFRNTKNVVSWADAQGFRVKTNNGFRKLRSREVDAYIYHYGWVKPPEAQQQKQLHFNRFWHEDAWIAENVAKGEFFDYKNCYAVQPFQGTHPHVMQSRIAESGAWTSSFNPSRLPGRPPKVLILDAFERLTGHRIGEYTNFHLV